jgi:hypothetical protein
MLPETPFFVNRFDSAKAKSEEDARLKDAGEELAEKAKQEAVEAAKKEGKKVV